MKWKGLSIDERNSKLYVLHVRIVAVDIMFSCCDSWRAIRDTH